MLWVPFSFRRISHQLKGTARRVQASSRFLHFVCFHFAFLPVQDENCTQKCKCKCGHPVEDYNDLLSWMALRGVQNMHEKTETIRFRFLSLVYRGMQEILFFAAYFSTLVLSWLWPTCLFLAKISQHASPNENRFWHFLDPRTAAVSGNCFLWLKVDYPGAQWNFVLNQFYNSALWLGNQTVRKSQIFAPKILRRNLLIRERELLPRRVTVLKCRPTILHTDGETSSSQRKNQRKKNVPFLVQNTNGEVNDKANSRCSLKEDSHKHTWFTGKLCLLCPPVRTQAHGCEMDRWLRIDVLENVSWMCIFWTSNKIWILRWVYSALMLARRHETATTDTKMQHSLYSDPNA